MKRKSIRLLIGAAVIGGLTGFWLYLKSDNKKAEEAALAETSGEEIINVDTENLNEISFYIKGQKEIFYQEGEQWKLKKDVTFPVDISSVLSPVAHLQPLLAVRVLEEAGDLSEYGLDVPQNVITLTDTDGQTTTVTIGDTNSGTGNDYLILNEDPSVIYTVEDSLRTAFSDDLYDYAYSDELPSLMVSEIIGVRAENGTEGYELYLEDAKWMTAELESTEAEPAGTGEQNGRKADADLVNDAMSTLGSLFYTDYVDHDCRDESEYGFSDTGVRLTICYQQERVQDENHESEEDSTEETEWEERQITFKIGTTDSIGNYYVQMEGSTEVHTLSGTILDPFLGKTAADWDAEETETESELPEESEESDSDKQTEETGNME